MKHVTGYTGFSGDPAEQSGHYLAIHAASTATSPTITAELIGGHHGPVTLDSDGILIARIEDPDRQKLKYTVTSGGNSITRTYSLRGLRLL